MVHWSSIDLMMLLNRIIATVSQASINKNILISKLYSEENMTPLPLNVAHFRVSKVYVFSCLKNV